MSNVLWSLVGKRVLAEEARNRFGSEVSLDSIDNTVWAYSESADD